jgi:hypothetical protein
MKEFILKRFSEPSTWMGALAVASAFGLDFTQDQQSAIALFGAIMCGMPDKQHNGREIGSGE